MEVLMRIGEERIADLPDNRDPTYKILAGLALAVIIGLLVWKFVF
jgi:hypothetical protein